jgi:ribosomal protein L11 methyltransferase
MSNSIWLEVSMTVNGELAEAVAEVFGRFAPNGVAMESFIEEGVSYTGDIAAQNLVKVACYLPVDDQMEGKRAQLEESIWYLGRIQALPELRMREVNQEDWADAWKRQYKPIPIGHSLMISPAWLDSVVSDRLQIKLDPGMAFGTGTHPSTQLCLELIEALIGSRLEPVSSESTSEKESAKKTFHRKEINIIDIGGGSGILSIGALKMGARRALCVDIDPIAVRTAKENALINGVEKNIEVRLGSLQDIKAGLFKIKLGFLVVANILAPVLIKLLDQGLKDLVEQDGYLILSGIISEQFEEIEGAAARNGMTIHTKKQTGDWIALCLIKS